MTEAKTDARVETHNFEAEVSKLLHMMVHSVYSERDVFLRELISNASDACDKLRYEAITRPELMGEDEGFAIRLALDPDARTLTVSDNGIGMSKEELISHLGTIARSGTAAFIEAAAAAGQNKDVSLIGQFGVGFYSVFMAADRVEVTSRRAGSAEAWTWTSEGSGSYSLAPSEKAGQGTDVRLHLKADADEYLNGFTLRRIVRTYSDHIAVPVILGGEKDETLNAGSALWTRPRGEITEEAYKEFFHHVGGFGEPAHTLHYRAEGMVGYTALLQIPDTRPFDLYDPARESHLKLYVKRVFITDKTDALLPKWLRFLRGIVDSEDLPLNISREMLQNNPVLARIRKAVTGKVLGELEKLAKDKPETFAAIWENFGAILKEGLYEDFERREALLKLARFRTTHDEGWTSLADYLSRKKDAQSAIYYVTGTDLDALKRSAHLEGYRARGIEVLLLTDPVDDFWIGAAGDFEGKPFRSITRGGEDLDLIAPAEKSADETSPEPESVDRLIEAMKAVLGGEVKDVRVSKRLSSSAVCLVADESDPDINLQRLLSQHRRLEGTLPRILEINAGHPVIRALSSDAEKEGAKDAIADRVFLLFDQARIADGEAPKDPQKFAERLLKLMEKAA